jgi:hypothetical protein
MPTVGADATDGQITIVSTQLDENVFTTSIDDDGAITAQFTQRLEAFLAEVETSAINQLQLLGAIRGALFNDLDSDGARDPGEVGLSGWTVFLDSNANGLRDAGEQSTVTSPDGSYAFINLSAGSYTVAELAPPGWRETFPFASDSATEVAENSNLALLTTTASDQTLALPVELADEPLIGASTGINDLAESVIKLDVFRADQRFATIDGHGIAAVVIDTGVDLDHPFFGPDLDRNGIADRIAYQYDFADNDNDASDRTGHGSVISSIIASENATYGGVAPQADLIVFKVFGDDGQGSFAELERALQWSVANAVAYNIAVVNLSLGDGGNWDEAVSLYGIGDELAALAALDVLVVAAAGNNFYQTGSVPGIAYPAADPAVLAVGAVWTGDFGGPWRFSSGATDSTTDADRIASFSQRAENLTDIFAPGARITGAGVNGGTLTMQGTSQAAAYLSGSAVLAQQLALEQLGRRLSLGEFATLLNQSSDLIIDGDDENDNVANSGLVFRRVNLLALAENIIALRDAGEISQSPTDGPPSTRSLRAHTIALAPGEIRTGIDFGNHRLIPPIAANDSATTDEDVVVSIDVLANDDDCDGTIDPGNVATTSAPAHGIAVVDRLTGRINYTPAANFFGSDSFRYSVKDNEGLLSNEAIVLITVNPVNNAPVANAGSDQTVRLGSVVQLDGRASSDPENDPLSYGWKQTNGPAVTLSNGDTATASFIPTVAGDYTFDLVVSEGKRQSVDSIVITVPRAGDLNGDGYVDTTDLHRLLTALHTPSSGLNDPFDLDGDGWITAKDIRRLSRGFTQARHHTESGKRT